MPECAACDLIWFKKPSSTKSEYEVKWIRVWWVFYDIASCVALLLSKADLLMTQKGLLIRIPMAKNDWLRYLSPDKINLIIFNLCTRDNAYCMNITTPLTSRP